MFHKFASILFENDAANIIIVLNIELRLFILNRETVFNTVILKSVVLQNICYFDEKAWGKIFIRFG